MHIPDSAISPSTCVVSAAVMLPIWITAARRIEHAYADRRIPLLAIGSAFCFTIMMFNLPAPFGTTAHPVGGVLMAVMLGPWAAVVGVSVALGIQAVLFNDGGLLAFAANCFHMAFVMPFVGYTAYRIALLGGRSMRPLAAAVGGYLGLLAASLTTATMLGVQPWLFHDETGRALYFPLAANIAVPAMALIHLMVASPVEAAVTGMAVGFLAARRPELFGDERAGDQRNVVFVAFLALIALTPLGLLASGDAWGEWNNDTLREMAGYLPRAFDVQRWASPIADYSIPGLHSTAGYVTSAILGVAAIGAVIFLVGRLVPGRQRQPSPSAQRQPDVLRAPAGVPRWFTAPNMQDLPAPSGLRRRDATVRTIVSLANGIAAAVHGERSARGSGLLQELEPRAKALGIIALVLAAALTSNLTILVFLWLIGLSLCGLSRLPAKLVAGRVAGVALLFGPVVALPASLNMVRPGEPLIHLWGALAISRPGAATAILFLLRLSVIATLSAAWGGSTRAGTLLASLRVLGIPSVFTTIAQMTYNYLFVLVRSAGEMFMAKESRRVGRVQSRRTRSFAAHSIANLFEKSLVMTEEVRMAMLSRGFAGKVRTGESRRFGRRELAWVVFSLCAVAISVAFDG